ncbi:UTP--glucose-1-phosphate uridylyltransferase GalU [Pseudalkalibacillus caeni]|uniref:UTP--glucose-1-phosphate uridylyltransferase n=1 Tax=Exobacillus caeni TaxID=2574798 RepID=A0A5R9EYA1_9BACL|nr:UTP--glucose-1-phosphate uridylyltransferase GalU [Pseudalkalibacillus caeni]TLS35176.1 UTP--glucose-1-phosphate uridylyltransferase GalU [Pseudalkalibacillus caeni]
MKVKKAIIPAAGLGTRFLPATKAQPKEMLPIVDKPTIQYIVEEAVEAGIEDIIIISGRGKRAIEDHFDKSYELEETLELKQKHEMLEEVRRISGMANIFYIRQKEPKGLGHAIGCASHFIGNEPFAVLLGDDIVQSETPCIKQLINEFNFCNSSILGVRQVPDQDIHKYGVVTPEAAPAGKRLFPISSVVEKPDLEEAPSNYAVMGRYILRPEIFNILETLPPGRGGEIQLTDAIKTLSESQAVYAYEFEGDRYDVGDKLGFIKATLDFALHRNDLKEDVYEYMITLIKQSN